MGRILSRYDVDAVSAMASGVCAVGACWFGLQNVQKHFQVLGVELLMDFHKVKADDV
jgi:hypothetical protein